MSQQTEHQSIKGCLGALQQTWPNSLGHVHLKCFAEMIDTHRGAGTHENKVESLALYRLSYGRFPKFHRVFLGRDPGTLKSNIVSPKTSTINLFGFETLKLKIRRLKLWKSTVGGLLGYVGAGTKMCCEQ